jgi:hypothetical protein
MIQWSQIKTKKGIPLWILRKCCRRGTRGAAMSRDMGDDCVSCEEDTSFGTGKFVNRLFVEGEWWSDELEDYEEREGYMCVECRSEPCGFCNKDTHEPHIINELGGGLLCGECYDNLREHFEANFSEDWENMVMVKVRAKQAEQELVIKEKAKWEAIFETVTSLDEYKDKKGRSSLDD